MPRLTSIELCAGAGGQAVGIEQAGFRHLAVLENDPHAAATLRTNRPTWNTLEEDIRIWSAKRFEGVDLLAAGLPCPPFSKAGKQLGHDDERNLFPAAARIIAETMPRAIMIENVRGLLDSIFEDFRASFKGAVEKLGYKAEWQLLNACDFGVPQLRPRVIFIAMKKELWPHFSWPKASSHRTTVGEALIGLMGSRGWEGAQNWALGANEIAPTLVGGSHKHGGPDLGPTRSKSAWAKLGVNGLLIGDQAPGPGFQGKPCLTVEMCALLQGFPPDWNFYGGKTAAYRQVGNAFPPPVASALGLRIAKALRNKDLAKVASRKPSPR